MTTQKESPLASLLTLAGRCPYLGLAGDPADFSLILESFRKNVRVLEIKHENPGLPNLISLGGGTGTGKSTIFNALACRNLSQTGVERPKTQGPILYCHESQAHWLRDGGLLPDYAIHVTTLGERHRGAAGDPQAIQVLLHQDPRWQGIFLFDTPDVDSVTTVNRRTAEDIYIVSDAICFVTSQEKYGDDIPFQMFRQALDEQKSIFIVMNKTESAAAFEELQDRVSRQAPAPLPLERFFSLPWHEDPAPEDALSQEPELRRLREILLDNGSPLQEGSIRKQEMLALETRILDKTAKLFSLLEAERGLADRLTERFRRTHGDIEKDLLEKSSEAMDGATQRHLRTEVMRVFRRYDLLRKPRNFVARILTSPLGLLRFGRPPGPEKRRKDLGKIHRKIDLQPLHAAIHAYNRRIHEEIAGLGREQVREVLLRKDLVLTAEDIDTDFFRNQENLEAWLEAKFAEMAKGIPKSKEWGIYSTTFLWGLFLVTVETVVGGGFTVFEAVLDSFIMPFISKGAADLFAYQELKALGQELDRRYKEQLKNVLKLQHDRYQAVLDERTLSGTDLELLKMHLTEMERRLQGRRPAR